MKLEGVIVALVTPFRDGKVDEAGVKRLTDRLLAAQVHGISPCGTTGEGSSLSDAEFERVVSIVLETAGNRVPVIPGTGSNNTEETIRRTKLAAKLGASAALVVTPYYVKPTQDGLVGHYTKIADECDLPLVLYNVPGRTAVNMLPETVERLAKHSQIIGVKECAALPQVADLLARVKGRLSVLSGEDGLFLPFLGLGGDGIISVTANVIPDIWLGIYRSVRAGRWEEARSKFIEFNPFVEACFIESNPIPIKRMLEMMGLISGDVRLPLSRLSAKNDARMKEELERLK